MVNARQAQIIQELIGRSATTWTFNTAWWHTSPTVDWTQVDYKFWDEARHCLTRGMELGGLFLKPLQSKVASWVQGTSPRLKVDQLRAQEVLTDWWEAHQSHIVRTYEEAVGLGDCFLVVNADLTTTVIPPHVVEPIVNEDDFSEVIGWRITEVHSKPGAPGETMTIIDEYTEAKRVRTIRRNGATVGEPMVYPNLIGRIPVVHVPNKPGVNSMMGEPEAAAALTVLQEYNEVLRKALTGNKHQSLPTPVAQFTGVEELEAFFEVAESTGLIESKTVTHDDGTTETYKQINFDSEQFMMLAGGNFDYKYPGQFAQDTETLLGLLFYLILQHTEIPEFAWGNAIASSKASAETQMGPFVRWIEKKRAECGGWMLELAQVVLAYSGLWETGVSDSASIQIGWEPLTSETGEITLKALQWLLSEQLIDEETAVRLAPVDIDDVLGVLKRARQEREERRQQEADQRALAPDEIDYERFLKDEEQAQSKDDDSGIEEAA